MVEWLIVKIIQIVIRVIGGFGERVFLSAQEEREREQVCRRENLILLRQCIGDARNIIRSEKLMDMQSHVLSLASTLFNMRARHIREYLDEYCTQKHNRQFNAQQKKISEMVPTRQEISESA